MGGQKEIDLGCDLGFPDELAMINFPLNYCLFIFGLA